MLQAEENRIRLARIRALEMLARTSLAEGDERAAGLATERARMLRLQMFPGIANQCRLPSRSPASR